MTPTKESGPVRLISQQVVPKVLENVPKVLESILLPSHQIPDWRHVARQFGISLGREEIEMGMPEDPADRLTLARKTTLSGGPGQDGPTDPPGHSSHLKCTE